MCDFRAAALSVSPVYIADKRTAADSYLVIYSYSLTAAFYVPAG